MYVLFGWGLFLLGRYAGMRSAPQFVEFAVDRTWQLANNHYQALVNPRGILKARRSAVAAPVTAQSQRQ